MPEHLAALSKWLKMSKFYSFTVTTNFFFRLFAVVAINKFVICCFLEIKPLNFLSPLKVGDGILSPWNIWHFKIFIGPMFDWYKQQHRPHLRMKVARYCNSFSGSIPLNSEHTYVAVDKDLEKFHHSFIR